MRREFDFFDEEVITQELDDLPAKDAAKLLALMEHYESVELGDPAPARVDDYGDGIRRLRHIKSAYQGRVLFYVGESGENFQKLWVLTVFKKEGRDVPRHVLDRARVRKISHEAMLRTKKRK